MKIKLPYFGNVTIDKNLVEQDYQVYEKFNDSLIEFNLTYETENLNQSDLSIVKDFLDNLEKHMLNAKDNIINNYNTNSEIQEFIKMHIDALTPLAKEVLNEIIPKDTLLENYFLEDLELVQIYIFADDQDEFVKFIYEISEEITDEKLFVRLDKNLIIKEIATEY